MVNKNKKKILLITLIILLFITAITLIVLNQTGVIERIIENNNKEEIKKEISYEVYKHVNGKTAMLVVAEDTENGIEKIIYPNNEMELYCNGKAKVAFDYNTDITGKESLTFKMVNTLGEEIGKTIAINDQFYLDMIDHSLTKETETQKALTVNYKVGSTVAQYRVGDNSPWVNYGDTIRLDDYQILETLGNDSRELKVSLRQIDKVGNEIVVESKLNYTIPETVIYKQEDTVIEGESIIDCVENNDLESGNYIFRVTGKIEDQNEQGVIETKTETIDYPVELYNYNGDANYITNSIASTNGIWYTGFGHINSEKRMLILKYNGNLTINSGVTITPTGTNQNINGATYLCTKKGMFIYCAGTLTNNGEITMTAKGTVNQAGENVYLYKNQDNSYEYVPAVGASGGASVTGIRSGKAGNSGTSRQTGGGGSGGVCQGSGKAVSGTGGIGTSYSGGSGGGGALSNYTNIYGESGSDIGGKGGNAKCEQLGTGGGAGNPGGNRAGVSGWGNIGSTGTGGLLVLNADTIVNNGTITSNGANGGYGYSGGGGGSGGGSINLFYKTDIKRGNITVYAGSPGPSRGGSDRIDTSGGAGGIGCSTIGSISTGTFVKDE